MRAFPASMDKLDKEFVEHLVYVFNQSLQKIRKLGWTASALERVGKMGLRLYRVFGAYKAKRQEYSPSEWLTKIDDVAKELIDGLS